MISSRKITSADGEELIEDANTIIDLIDPPSVSEVSPQTRPLFISEDLPATFELLPNHPNPFNPSTIITYSIPEQAPVTLSVYNMLGQQVKTLVNETIEAGHHEVIFDATGLPSGMYLYRLVAPGVNITQTMLLLK